MNDTDDDDDDVSILTGRRYVATIHISEVNGITKPASVDTSPILKNNETPTDLKENGDKIIKIKRGDKTVFIIKINESYVNIIKGENGCKMPIESLVSLAQGMGQIKKYLHRRGDMLNFKTGIGGHMYVQIQSKFKGVSIRDFYRGSDGKLKPMKNGCTSRHPIFFILAKYIEEELGEEFPPFGRTVLCLDRGDHCNQEAAITCTECNPDQEGVELFM